MTKYGHSRNVCGIIAKNIGRSDKTQNEFDNLADDIESWISRKGSYSEEVVSKIRKMAEEERKISKEFTIIFKGYNCHLGESGGAIIDKSL